MGGVWCRTISLRKVRRQLEEDLGLEEDGLKAHKDLIAKLIDKASGLHSAAQGAQQAGSGDAEEKDFLTWSPTDFC